MRTNEPGWLKRETPPSWRSSLKQAQLTWLGYICTAANPGTILIGYMSEALATTLQWRVDAPVAAITLESKGSQVLASKSSPAHQTGTPPLPSPPISDIPLIGAPLRYSLVGFIINPQCKKQDCSPSSTPDDQPCKRAHTGTAETNVSSWYSTPQSNGEPPEMSPEAHDNNMVASGSTGGNESEDNTDYCGDESTQDELRENMADSNLESASGDCLSCLDTKEVVIRNAWKRFQKKVQAPCSIVRGCLWSQSQLKQIQDSHQTMELAGQSGSLL